jgi:hypothetical protein
MNYWTSLFPWKSTPTERTIENVCFQGGGMKGLAFVGVAKALDELKQYSNIKRCIGSSAGAIFATAVACRMSPSAISNMVDQTDFSLFLDRGWGWVGEGYNLWESMGVHSGEYFFNWLSKMLQEHVGDSQLTFSGLNQRFGTELVITTTDLTARKLVYLSKDTTPDMEIRQAIRMSMSIPVLFEPVTRVESDGLTHVYVDGGCTSNFPISYFPNTLGFSLDEPMDPKPVTNAAAVVISLINTDIDIIQDLRIPAECKDKIVKIPTFGLDSTNFSMSKDDIRKLEQSGYDATRAYFQNRDKLQ